MIEFVKEKTRKEAKAKSKSFSFLKSIKSSIKITKAQIKHLLGDSGNKNKNEGKNEREIVGDMIFYFINRTI
jgi:hypothetical protein